VFESGLSGLHGGLRRNLERSSQDPTVTKLNPDIADLDPSGGLPTRIVPLCVESLVEEVVCNEQVVGRLLA